MRRTTPLILLLSAATGLPAGVAHAQMQSPPPATAAAARPAAVPAVVTRAAATITEADVRRRIHIIADDSMMGRDTPSRGLDLTAQYIADEFKRFGLKPGGENGTYFQRYPITRRKLVPESSSVTLTSGASSARASLAESARFVLGSVPAAPVEGSIVLMGGAVTPEAAASAPVKDKVVVVVADYQNAQTAGARTQALRALFALGPKAIVLVSNLDSAAFAARLPSQSRERTVIDLGGPARPAVVEVHETAVAPFAAAAKLDLATLRTGTTFQALDGTARLDLKEAITNRTTAPNTIGILEGSDPKLKSEYVVYSAHMDHVGTAGGGSCQARGGDTICNGADDDGSGTVGVIELAEAFSQKGVKPKRSIVFITVSGEEKGLWGSQYFSEHPTVPVKSMVANINIDMIGRNWKDTIVAIGKEHSDLGATLARVNTQHPELNMVAIDDKWPEERFYFRSDHYNFARKGVPILFFFNGVHPDYHQVGDSPDKLDAEKESRIVQLLFYLGYDIANAAQRPQWNQASYAEIVEGPGGR